VDRARPIAPRHAGFRFAEGRAAEQPKAPAYADTATVPVRVKDNTRTEVPANSKPFSHDVTASEIRVRDTPRSQTG
jgi:hypothetical protein